MDISKYEIKNRIDCVGRAKYIKEKLAVLISNEKDLCKKMQKMAILQVGDDFASNIYIKNKINVANKIGIDVELKKFSIDTVEHCLVEQILQLNNNSDYCGMIVQLPLPKHIDSFNVLNAISPSKDLDGLNPINVGLLHYAKSIPYCVDNVIDGTDNDVFIKQSVPFIPCTPLGCLDILQQEEKRHFCDKNNQNNCNKFSIKGSNAVVIGNSNLVGKPMSRLLIQSGATTTTVHSRSENFDIFLQNADIIVSATGVGQRMENLKKNAVVIDVAIRKDDNGNICGDVDYAKMIKTNRITPVPYGIGPMTITCLILNYYLSVKRNRCL